MNKVILVFSLNLLRADEQDNLSPAASMVFIYGITLIIVNILPHSRAREWSPAMKYRWTVTADQINTEAIFKYFITAHFIYRIY